MRTTLRWAAAILAILALPPLVAGPALAATGLEGFDAEYLISDRVMNAADTMTAADLQSFLATQGTKCVNGTDGSPCIKDAAFTTPTRAATEFCQAYAGGTNEPASLIIAKTALACGVNPQVLAVMLQKEQGLVTTTNPTATNYQSAMGFRCPDGSGCEPQYAGFANQVYFAAARLNEYRLYPERFSYRAGGTYNVQYHPDFNWVRLSWSDASGA